MLRPLGQVLIVHMYIGTMKKMGYMGIPLSNSENAAQIIAEEQGMKVEFVPLITSEGVVKALLDGSVDYGVVATKNVIAGPVIETVEALSLGNIKKIIELGIPIHHCIFVKVRGVKISAIASHIQALAQTQNNVSKLFPQVDRIEVDDTALAAEMLADGRLLENTAVICGMAAKIHNDLMLVKENVEDDKENMTYFALMEAF